MTELYVDNAASLGRDMLRTADAPSQSFGSTDMGNVLIRGAVDPPDCLTLEPYRL